jgi:transcriptional antiterminator
VKTSARHNQIVSLIDEHSFLTVSELSRYCDVSEMTIRRDLEKLDAMKRIQRTYGGAVSLHNGKIEEKREEETTSPLLEESTETLPLDQVDVLIATSVNPYYDNLLIDKANKKNIPIIAESIEMPNQRTIVAVDNYRAGYDLGTWAGEYFERGGVRQVH